MTNREWLRGKNNKELAKLINKNDTCDFCVRSINGDCDSECCTSSEYCEEGIVEWFNMKHIEPFPKLHIGDILQFRFKDGLLIYTASVVGEGYMYSDSECELIEITDSRYKIIEVRRFDGEKLEIIWRDYNVE